MDEPRRRDPPTSLCHHIWGLPRQEPHKVSLPSRSCQHSIMGLKPTMCVMMKQQFSTGHPSRTKRVRQQKTNREWLKENLAQTLEILYLFNLNAKSNLYLPGILSQSLFWTFRRFEAYFSIGFVCTSVEIVHFREIDHKALRVAIYVSTVVLMKLFAFKSGIGFFIKMLWQPTCCQAARAGREATIPASKFPCRKLASSSTSSSSSSLLLNFWRHDSFSSSTISLPFCSHSERLANAYVPNSL